METDQIQKALYAKSDAETKSKVRAVLQPVDNWRQARPIVTVSLPVVQGVLIGRDGTQIHTKNHTTAQDVYNELRYARVNLHLDTVLEVMEEAMIAMAQPADRLAFVNNFIAEVENLRATADELADRVSDVERHQQS